MICGEEVENLYLSNLVDGGEKIVLGVSLESTHLRLRNSEKMFYLLSSSRIMVQVLVSKIGKVKTSSLILIAFLLTTST